MSTTYFGGSSVRDGRVRRLQATNFKELTDHYIRSGVVTSYTRKEFNSWDTATKDFKKDGPFIVACSYDAEECKREDDTATAVTLVIIDLDEGQFVKDFFESPETIGEHLYPLNFAAYTTAKHTAKAPRLKIVVDVTPCHPSMHRRLVADVLRRLGLPDTFKGSRESKTLSLPQYRPLAFKGEQFSSVIASRTNGVPLHPSDVLIAEDEDEEGRTFACDRGDGEDGLGAIALAFMPVAGLTVEDIREPLMKIDADCDYKTWCQVACALRHQFTEEEDAAAAYALFDEWSATGSKYKGEKDTYGKWRSFKAYAKGRTPVTIRSLFKFATNAGWENTKVSTKLKLSALEWIAACEDGDELMVEGAKRIAALPFANEVVEEALIMAWRKKLNELTGNLIAQKTLKKEVMKCRRRDIAEAKSKEDHTPVWLMPICYVATENAFYDTTCGVSLSPASFDLKHGMELMPPEGEDAPPNGRPVVQPKDYALNVLKIPRVDSTIYYPLHKGEDSYFEYPKGSGRFFLNIYSRNSVPIPVPDHAERAETLLRGHLAHLVQEPWLIDLLIDYLAMMVQFPGRKIRWSPFFQSGEGAGKGILGKVISAVLGARNVRIVSPEILSSQWNDWAQNTQFILLEEVHIPGERRERVINSIKQVITDDVISVNKRNTHAQCDVPNFANLWAFSNYKDALHLKNDARRWLVIYSPLQTASQIAGLNESGHFEKLEWLFSPEGASALRYYLSTCGISDGFPVNGPAPHTNYRDEVILSSKNPLHLMVEELIEDGTDPLVGRDLILQDRLIARIPTLGRDSGRIGHVLTALGYSSKRMRVGGVMSSVWMHREYPCESPERILEERSKIEEFDI